MSKGSFGTGSGRIYLNSLRCAGDEPSLLDCPQGDVGVAYCNYYHGAGVICACKDMMNGGGMSAYIPCTMEGRSLY